MQISIIMSQSQSQPLEMQNSIIMSQILQAKGLFLGSKFEEIFFNQLIFQLKKNKIKSKKSFFFPKVDLTLIEIGLYPKIFI